MRNLTLWPMGYVSGHDWNFQWKFPHLHPLLDHSRFAGKSYKFLRHFENLAPPPPNNTMHTDCFCVNIST